MTYQYEAPQRLEEDYQAGRLTPYDEMMSELSDDVENLKAMIDIGTPVIPIQGRVSDYKSWLAAALAMQLSDQNVETTLFLPQKGNREDTVDKLRAFGARILEHPGRLDLCIWQPWLDTVGYVDKATCESIGCPYYVNSKDDVRDRTEHAMSVHRMSGHTDLDTEEMRELGTDEDFCPAQLYLEARDMPITDGAVNVATYAKAFADAAIASDDPLNSDVLLMDEAHTVAANPNVVHEPIDPEKTMSALSMVMNRLSGSEERWAMTAHEDIEEVSQMISFWLARSEDGHVDPDEIFAGDAVSLGDSFESVNTIRSRLSQSIRRSMQQENFGDAADESVPYNATRTIQSFLSRIEMYRNGSLDFIHDLYTEGGEEVNNMAFRRVTENHPADGCTAAEVFSVWQEDGTHPAIANRWGALLDRYIEALWDGRSVSASDGCPSAPMMPMDRLREIAGADTVITLSATHNELSDPTRGPLDGKRPTRHRIICAPVNLRASGSGAENYDGSPSVSPETPWFRDLVRSAQEESGDTLAVVPINKSNEPKWDGLPVMRIPDGDDGSMGVVPNTRGSIGVKELESMDVDTVACGVQVQSPAPTARMVVRFWESLAPRRTDPREALRDSWKLLAQHAVSGTIQAGGRFDWDAVNFVFEDKSLFDLAGFETEEATEESPGFAGAFCRQLNRLDGEWRQQRAAVRSARVVDYLRRSATKSPTTKQFVGEYKRMYGADDTEARSALRLGVQDGRIVANTGDGKARYDTA